MQSLDLLVLVLAFTAQSFCFTVPPGQADGVYSVHTNTFGIEVHIPLSSNATARASQNMPTRRGRMQRPKRELQKLQKYWGVEPLKNANQLVCFDYLLDKNEVDAANAGLDAKCGTGLKVNLGTDVYSIVNCTVSYFCNYNEESGFLGIWGYDSGLCKAEDRRAASEFVFENCEGGGGGGGSEGKEVVVVAGYDRYTRYILIKDFGWRELFLGGEHWVDGSYGVENVCRPGGMDFCGRNRLGHELEPSQ